ncbi:MAG: hypothetical protein IJ733_02460 [Lachnospiraceae bacterium]|nr:hypothetical protein [Lachnospiraceae bacterium]
MIGFIIWSLVAALFAGVGLSTWKSDEAVGFFTFVKPPVIRDAKAYNHAVSVLWMVSAVLLEMIGIPLLLLEQNSPMFIPIIFAVVVLIIGMIIVYLRLEAKYRE